MMESKNMPHFKIQKKKQSCVWMCRTSFCAKHGHLGSCPPIFLGQIQSAWMPWTSYAWWPIHYRLGVTVWKYGTCLRNVSMNQLFSDGSNHEATVSITRNFMGQNGPVDPCQLMGDRDDHLQKIRCLRGNMSWIYHFLWRCPKSQFGVPLVLIFILLVCSIINHPAIKGSPNDHGTPLKTSYQ